MQRRVSDRYFYSLIVSRFDLYPIQKVTEIYNKVTEIYKKVTELEISMLRSEVAYIGTGHILS